MCTVASGGWPTNGNIGCSVQVSCCVQRWHMDRSGDKFGRGDCVGRQDIRKSHLAQSGRPHHQRSRSLARLDSTRLVSASDNWKVTIWDIGTRKREQTLDHGNWVKAAKYSPQGDRIATATETSVRVWDSNDGRLLMDIKVTVTPWFNTGLLWFDNHLFVVSGSKITQLEASTGSTVSEWPVPNSIKLPCIALPKHRKFIAYSTQCTVTFWDTATHTQPGPTQHPRSIRSIAVSPDDRFLAVGAEDGKITINSLSRISVSILSLWIVEYTNNFLTPIILS